MGHLKSRKSNKKNNALFLIRIKNISQLELAVLFNFFLQCLYKEVVWLPCYSYFLGEKYNF